MAFVNLYFPGSAIPAEDPLQKDFLYARSLQVEEDSRFAASFTSVEAKINQPKQKDSSQRGGEHVTVLDTNAKLGLYADKTKWQLLNPRASTLAAITLIRDNKVPEESISNIRKFIWGLTLTLPLKKREDSIQPNPNGAGEALQLLRSLFDRADPASVNDLLITTETTTQTYTKEFQREPAYETTRNPIVVIPFAMLSDTLLTDGYQEPIEGGKGKHTYTYAFGESQQYICIELTPHEGKAPTSGDIPLYLKRTGKANLVLHSGIVMPAGNHFTAFVCHKDPERCALYDDSFVAANTTVREVCRKKGLWPWVKMLVYGKAPCSSRPQQGIRQCAGGNSCYLAAPLIVLAAMDGIEQCFKSDVHVNYNGSWEKRPGRGIYVIGPGARKNEAAYELIPGECTIFGDIPQSEHVYNSYEFTSLGDLREKADLIGDKGLLTMIPRMCKAIRETPPEMIIAGSRGAKEVLPYLLEYCWRGPFVSLNAGPLLATPRLPMQCTPCFVTYGADTMEPYSTCKSLEQVKLKFERKADQDTNGLHVFLPGMTHSPALPKYFFRDLYFFLKGKPLNPLRDLAADASVSLLHKASK